MIARTRFLELKKKALARHRWHAAYLKVKVFGLFNRQLRLIHVDRLEKDNATLMNSMAAVTDKLNEAQEEVMTAKLQLKQLQVSYDEVKIEAKQQQQRVEELELALQARRFEVAELRRQTTGGSLVERIIRFFTCSAAISPPSSPRGMVTPSRLPSLRRQTQSASEETSDKSERIVWATPLSDAVMIPQEEDGSGAKRRISVTAVSDEPTFDSEEEEFRSKDADMLWSVSRYMF
ncbi:Myosin-like protein [Phytophthora palmivora]|nr:Myosin-like protein [Phytophthora palmivora]